MIDEADDERILELAFSTGEDISEGVLSDYPIFPENTGLPNGDPLKLFIKVCDKRFNIMTALISQINEEYGSQEIPLKDVWSVFKRGLKEAYTESWEDHCNRPEVRKDEMILNMSEEDFNEYFSSQYLKMNKSHDTSYAIPYIGLMENNGFNKIDVEVGKYNKTSSGVLLADSDGLRGQSFQLGRIIAEAEISNFPDMDCEDFILHCRSQFYKDNKFFVEEINNAYKKVGNSEFLQNIWVIYHYGLGNSSLGVWEKHEREVRDKFEESIAWAK